MNQGLTKVKHYFVVRTGFVTRCLRILNINFAYLKFRYDAFQESLPKPGETAVFSAASAPRTNVPVYFPKRRRI